MAPKRPHEALDPTSSSQHHASDAKKRKGFRVGPENLPDGAWRRRNTKIKEELIHKAKVKKAYRKVKAELQHEREEGEAAAQQIHPDRLLRIDDENNKTAAAAGTGDNDQDDNAAPPRRERQQNKKRQPRHPATGPNGEAPATERRERRQEAEADAGEEATLAAVGEARDEEGGEEARAHCSRKPRRPDYYEKALREGNQKKAEAEERAAEQKRREEERERKFAEREKIRRAMLKARGMKPGGAAGGRGQFGRQQQGPRKLGRESHVLLERVKRMVS